MMFIFTSMFFCSRLNCCTICGMIPLPPPVNPFQNSMVTFGPLYFWPPPPPACCTAGLLFGPPQPARASPAPAPAPTSKNSWRVILRTTEPPLPTLNESLCLPPPSWCKPNRIGNTSQRGRYFQHTVDRDRLVTDVDKAAAVLVGAKRRVENPLVPPSGNPKMVSASCSIRSSTT